MVVLSPCARMHRARNYNPNQRILALFCRLYRDILAGGDVVEAQAEIVLGAEINSFRFSRDFFLSSSFALGFNLNRDFRRDTQYGPLERHFQHQ